ncbi:MAG TPA: LacI family DNA-binding transcriptional regulator [Anaerolineales bacterium]
MTVKTRPPTIADVAHRAAVSIATVSRVLNGTTPVQAEKAERVRRAMEELHFVPHTAARTLASRRTNTIGLILDEIGRDFFSPLLRGIEAAAREARYDLLIKTTGSPHASLASIDALGQHNTDGLIVFIDSLNEKELARLHKIGFPLVLMHQTPPEELDIPIITIENKSGAQKLVEHLIEVHGCRRIVFLQGPEGNEDSEWRERGYREALETHGIEYDPALITSGGFDDEQAFHSIQQMLLDRIEMDAIFAGDDEAAMGAIRALRMAGRLVPADVAVVGFDDVPFARHLSPTLTTVRAPIEGVGGEAVRQLLHLINGEPAEALTLMPVKLILRESCGCESKQASIQDELLSSTRR